MPWFAAYGSDFRRVVVTGPFDSESAVHRAVMLAGTNNGDGFQRGHVSPRAIEAPDREAALWLAKAQLVSEDDEPTTAEDLAAIAEAEESIACEGTISFAEWRRRRTG